MSRKYRVGVHSDEIVDAAVRLTELRGLDGWSLRELVAEVGTSPSVVYHRIGDRTAVCARVVLRVLPFSVTPPEPGVDWKRWFLDALVPLRAALRPYPGVAQWILLHGVPAPHADGDPGPPAVDEMDAVLALLHGAGFGEDTALVFALVVNSALTTIALEDRRSAHPGPGIAHFTSVRSALRDRGPRSGFAAALGTWFESFAGPDEAVEQAMEHYYRSMIATVLDGVEARFGPAARGPRGSEVRRAGSNGRPGS